MTLTKVVENGNDSPRGTYVLGNCHRVVLAASPSAATFGKHKGAERSGVVHQQIFKLVVKRF